MSNTQITLSDIQRLINEMRVMYGKKFTDQWSSVGAQELEKGFFKRLGDLSKEQIVQGFNRMNSEAWPPSIPEFRTWCTQGSSWFTEHEAWLQALAYERSGQTKSISHCTLQALSELKDGYSEIKPTSESQAKAFRDIYVRKVNDAKLEGRGQTFTQVRPAIATTKPYSQKHSPCPPELLEKMRSAIKGRVA